MIIGEDVSLADALKRHFGFDQFKGEQEEIIQNLLNGNDTFVIMPTGGGKSLCYQLPALISEGTAVIISPLIALMKNQVDAVRGFHTNDSIAHFMNSSLSKGEIQRVKSDIVAGYTKMLYVAPESLTKQENIDFLRGIKVSFVAVDEAHCISEWGHDFRPEYRRIKEMIRGIDENTPIIALTATATPKVQQDIQKNLGMARASAFKSSFNRPNLFYEVRPKINALKEIIKFIKGKSGKSGIIYCLSRKKVEEIAQTLIVNGIKALPYHAGFDAATRANNQDQFLMEEVDEIVATIAFGMGIDKPDVRFVIHFDMPKSLEGYYQETGRAGRDGGEGHCVAFYDYKDIEKLEKFMQGKPVAEQEVGRQLLQEVVAYAETAMSRRKFLLHYFGEEFDEEHGEGAKMDDNATNPKEQVEGRDQVVLLLQAIGTLKERFKAKHILDVVMGKGTSEAISYKHDQLPLYASGKDHDDKFWMAVVRQTTVAGLINKDIESYGCLKITEKGQQFLATPRSFMIIRDHDYDQLQANSALAQNQKHCNQVADKALFNLLKELRKKIARQKNLPPFVLFQDPSLEDMANQFPIDMEELKNIVGVGAGKAIKFGKPFLELIKQYVEDNNIERPQDMVVKSVVNKSGQKVYIIQSIDRKVPLEDIADAKGLSLGALITEIENIVYSGTKVDINYYINDVLDEDHQDEVYDYFREDATTDSVEAAIEELGDDEYSEDEIRLMRIKFMSEMGN
ncbi:MAG: DNA helicase RecQ [Salibacteraceae bacterium]